MRTLTMALYAEGSTDYRFLTTLIQRTAEKLLCAGRASDVSVLDPLPIEHVEGTTGAEKIFNAAQITKGMDLLVIHLDADGRKLDLARKERFQPGLNLVRSSDTKVGVPLIPIIPIKNIEAWLLCDVEAFQRIVGTRLNSEALGFVQRCHQVESIPDPKQCYYDAVRMAHSNSSRRRKTFNPGQYYERLGREIDLNKLAQVPAFRHFEAEFADLLRGLHFVT